MDGCWRRLGLLLQTSNMSWQGYSSSLKRTQRKLLLNRRWGWLREVLFTSFPFRKKKNSIVAVFLNLLFFFFHCHRVPVSPPLCLGGVQKRPVPAPQTLCLVRWNSGEWAQRTAVFPEHAETAAGTPDDRVQPCTPGHAWPHPHKRLRACIPVSGPCLLILSLSLFRCCLNEWIKERPQKKEAASHLYSAKKEPKPRATNRKSSGERKK